MHFKVVKSESRRLKRIKQNMIHTTCFACRKQGHTAKDCPKTTAGNNDEENHDKKATVVGICYR